jgi:hypothetical protein
MHSNGQLSRSLDTREFTLMSLGPETIFCEQSLQRMLPFKDRFHDCDQELRATQYRHTISRANDPTLTLPFQTRQVLEDKPSRPKPKT